jgi:hypothetical protein
MQTGENTQGLRKITDMIRNFGVLVLVLHYYVFCYGAFERWHLTHPVLERLLINIHHTGLFNHVYTSKLLALICLLISLLGTKGRKEEKLSKMRITTSFMATGILLYWGSIYLLKSISTFKIPITSLALIYIVITSLGFLLLLRGGALLTRLITLKLEKDVFNQLQESFPQEERLRSSPFSINLPAIYQLDGKSRKSWINIINPFRGTLVAGTPGSGKSYFVIRHVITQHIQKGFTMFIYDFKFDDLTKIAYNTILDNTDKYPVPPKFYMINFDDLRFTHRCNPLDPKSMTDIMDATESARTIMLGLNREWIRKTGDFFVESPINFVTAIIWFLRKYKDGAYCTLPHVIELMQVDYEKLFPVLRSEPEIEVLINPFVTAFTNKAMEQLEGQVGSAKITMARLSSPHLYYVLSGSDFTLDLNNPKDPKIICVGNNYMKQQVYGAVLSLYTSRMIKLVNRKGQLKSSLIFDEFPTIYFNGMDSLIATARSNQVATCLGVQDFSQLRKDYGRDQADVIANVVGNIIAGQVTGDTAKLLSDRFGRIMQDRRSMSVNSMDTSISRSMQLDAAIPASKIATLSSGEMVGIVADNPEEKIKLKMFHAEIQNDHKRIKAEEDQYQPIPQIRNIKAEDVQNCYQQIKNDVQLIIETEMERIMASADLSKLIMD